MCMIARPNATGGSIPSFGQLLAEGGGIRDHTDDDVLHVADGGGGGEGVRRDVSRGRLFILSRWHPRLNLGSG